jgi:DNA transformation protein
MPENSFKEFVLDQLGMLPEVRARAMFGAHGLYQADRFFGILDEGRLFFKVNESSRPAYGERGMGPFTYESRGRTMTMSYYEVPPDVLENAVELVEWARTAIQVAAAAKAREKAKKPARRE